MDWIFLFWFYFFLFVISFRKNCRWDGFGYDVAPHTGLKQAGKWTTKPIKREGSLGLLCFACGLSTRDKEEATIACVFLTYAFCGRRFRGVAFQVFGFISIIIPHRRNNNYPVHFPDSVIATLPSKYGHETVARQTTKIRQHQTGSGGRCHHNSSSPSTTTKTNYPDPTSARHYTALPRRRGRSA